MHEFPCPCLYVLYMTKKEGLRIAGRASEGGNSGQHLGFILVSLA